MKIKLTILLLLLINGALYSQTLKDPGYLVETEIVKSEELGRKVIQIKFYSRFLREKVSPAQVFQRATDFNSWPVLLNDLPEEPVHIETSRRVIRELTDNGTELLHWVEYWVKAPWPISKVRVKEKSIYIQIDTSNEGDIYYEFYPDPQFKAKGIRHKKGYGILEEVTEGDTVYVDGLLYFEVIPQIDIFLGLAAPYVERGLVAVFEGLFGEYLD